MRALVRRTKIVATLGPATESDAAVDSLIKAGVDVVRLNFSHGTVDEHKARAEKIRRIGLENNRHLAILADLQGPKIRAREIRKWRGRSRRRRQVLSQHRMSRMARATASRSE